MKHVCFDCDVTECFLIQKHVDSVLANHKSVFWVWKRLNILEQHNTGRLYVNATT